MIAATRAAFDAALFRFALFGFALFRVALFRLTHPHRVFCFLLELKD
jgi:hypothetical protein